MTDEQFDRLMKRLDEIERRLPIWPPMSPGYVPYNQFTCAFCGGYHGLGMMCPRLQPGVVSTNIGRAL